MAKRITPICSCRVSVWARCPVHGWLGFGLDVDPDPWDNGGTYEATPAGASTPDRGLSKGSVVPSA